MAKPFSTSLQDQQQCVEVMYQRSVGVGRLKQHDCMDWRREKTECEVKKEMGSKAKES